MSIYANESHNRREAKRRLYWKREIDIKAARAEEEKGNRREIDSRIARKVII